MSTTITSQNRSSESAVQARENLYRLFKERPMKDDELLVNLAMFMRSGSLAKILFLNEMYQKIIDLPGIICEFGVWMGQSTITFENLRAVYEPYNYQRRIVGFDTFSGYTGIGDKDIPSEIISDGVYSVSQGYEHYLEELLDYHEKENVMAHIKKHSLIKGDASITCKDFIEHNPEVIVAMAYFDMALYEPTKNCLEAILPRLIKGSVLVFDELCHPNYPGETQAVFEVLQTRNHTIRRSKFLPDRSYIVIE
ncbi:MAG: TylF/MycF/NovP-related O-methyltransferase [Methylococcales bacterium]|nr:TylF/MycF/NovP-related O-methyltransferase [Methylococcales bacterium]